MSISPPVGALNQYLARLMSGRVYRKAVGLGERVLGELARRAEEHVKGMVTPGTMFEEFGFNYIGPIDGHDLDSLIPTLTNIRELRGPQFLHIVTRKGQGYKLAEADPVLYHGVSKFDHANGIVGGKSGGKPTYTQVFGDWICDMAEADSRLVGITPAMREGSGLVKFAERFPERYFDVGIAEQHARHVRGGPRVRGHEAGRRDLLHVPAARLRPADPRRADPEPADRASRSTARVWSAPTARRTTAASTCRTCAACRT
jgi:1-deoxy-D-xylulose-5-phosphate synthase